MPRGDTWIRNSKQGQLFAHIPLRVHAQQYHHTLRQTHCESSAQHRCQQASAGGPQNRKHTAPLGTRPEQSLQASPPAPRRLRLGADAVDAFEGPVCSRGVERIDDRRANRTSASSRGPVEGGGEDAAGPEARAAAAAAAAGQGLEVGAEQGVAKCGVGCGRGAP